MKNLIGIIFLVIVYGEAFCQHERKMGLHVALGWEISGSSTFKNDHNVSLSGYYRVADQWAVGAYIEQRKYSLDRPIGEHQAYVGGSKPDIQKNVISYLVTGIFYPVGENSRINPYLSFGVGYSSSKSSSESFNYYDALAPRDTLMFRIKSGSFVLGLASLGLDWELTSFIDVFAEIQVPSMSNQDPFPFALGGRIGVGFEF